jgi:hypothetical protein
MDSLSTTIKIDDIEKPKNKTEIVNRNRKINHHHEEFDSILTALDYLLHESSQITSIDIYKKWAVWDRIRQLRKELPQKKTRYEKTESNN